MVVSPESSDPPSPVSELHAVLSDSEENNLVVSLLSTIQCILTPFCPRWPISKEKKDTSSPVDLQQRLADFVKYVHVARFTLILYKGLFSSTSKMSQRRTENILAASLTTP